MKLLKVEEAVGQVLCHDMTRIVPGESKSARFKKGHIIQEEDVPVLLSMGKERIYIWEKPEGFLHEDEAAEALAALCKGAGIDQKGPAEGKIELRALSAGLFNVDEEKVNQINAVGGIVISTRHNNTAAAPGDKLAAMKAIPLVIAEEKLREARAIAGDAPLMRVLPFRLKSAAVITTGSEVAAGRIADGFTPLITKKLEAYGITVVKHAVVPDGVSVIAEAIAEARSAKPDMVLCLGGMSVDPDDNTPGAIQRSGAAIVTYGTPVLPGAMFLLAYFDDGVPVMGIPGCVMYDKATVFDMILPRVAAGQRLERGDFSRMGVGGLCLSCGRCEYPVCPFGK